MHPIIILGAGHAAYSLAREIRRHNEDQPITLICRDSGDSYYKPNLSKALAMNKSPEQLVLKTREQQEQTLAIKVMPKTTVESIDAALQQVKLNNGEQLSYQALVFASGADSRRLEIAGNADSEVFHVNDLEQYQLFIERAKDAEQVLIMGAGLVGCEFANDLHSQGIGSTIVEPAPYPLAALLPPALGEALQQGLNSIGVEQHYGCHVTKLDKAAGRVKATLSSGKTLRADLVLSAAGLSVNTALAQQAGIECGRGIKVNQQLSTNLPSIYALGDCAEINGQLRPFIAPILPSVKALAQTLLGKPTAAVFGPMPVTVKTPCCPVIACPPQSPQGEWTISGEASDLLAQHHRNGKLSGFAATGKATAQAKTLLAEMA